MILQSAVQGLSYGALYALMAFGLVLIYKTMDIVNFANGEITMISAFVTFTLLVRMRMPIWAAILGTIAFAGIFGAAIERIFLRPVENGPLIGMIIVTMGLVMTVQGLALWIFGYNPAYMPPLVTGMPLRIGSVIITRDGLLQLGTALALSVVLYLLVQRTRLGPAMNRFTRARLRAVLTGLALVAFPWIVGRSGFLLYTEAMVGVSIMAATGLNILTGVAGARPFAFGVSLASDMACYYIALHQDGVCVHNRNRPRARSLRDIPSLRACEPALGDQGEDREKTEGQGRSGRCSAWCFLRFVGSP